MGLSDFGGINDPLSNPPLGGPNGWAAAVVEAIEGLQEQHTIRSTRPNTTDHLVEVFDGSEWVMSRYDSGWRDVSGLITSGAFGSIGAALLRRTLHGVQFQLRASLEGGSLAGTALGDVFAIPAGFQPMDYTIQLGLFVATVPLTFSNSSDRAVLAVVRATTTDIPATGALTGTFDWPCTDPLPSSLPGILYSAAP
jgi:hypothetical protein